MKHAILIAFLAFGAFAQTNDDDAVTAAALAQNFFTRNNEAGGWVPTVDVNLAPLRAVHVAWPGFDEDRTHAMIVGAMDRTAIYMATLEKKDGVWRATWTGTMPPMREEPPAPPRAPLPPDVQPIRVGGDVKAPVVLTRVDPILPARVVEEHISGIVILEAVIDKNGRVRDVQILKPLPYGASEAVKEAVTQLTFRPGTLNNLPVDVIFNLTVNVRGQS